MSEIVRNITAPGGITTVAAGGTGASTPEGASQNLQTDFVVASLAAIKTLTTFGRAVTNRCRSVAGDQGGGTWVFLTGDQSANVSADPESGLWAAPNSAPTGTSGAWQRQYVGPASSAWFGFLSGGIAVSNYTALQAAVTTAYSVYVPYGDYTISQSVLVANGYSSVIGDIRMPFIRIASGAGPVFKVIANGTALNEWSRIENLVLWQVGVPTYANPPTADACGLAITGASASVPAAVQRCIVQNMRIMGFGCGVYAESTVNTKLDRVIVENHTDWSAQGGFTSANQYVPFYFNGTPYTVGGISPQASIEVFNCIANGNFSPTAVTAYCFKLYGQDPRDVFFTDCETAGGDYGWYGESTDDDFNFDVHLIRCIVDAVRVAGIYFKNWTGAAALSIIGGYVVKNTNAAGAHAWLENCSGVSISGGLQLLGVSNDGNQDEGIRFKNCSNCVITSAIVMNCRFGISFDGSTLCIATGNVIYAHVNYFEPTPTLDTAIRCFNTATFNNITNNTIKGASASYKYTAGILFQGLSDNNVYSGNIIDAATVTTPVFDAGTANGLPLGATYVAGAPMATGYVTQYDADGTALQVLVAN